MRLFKRNELRPTSGPEAVDVVAEDSDGHGGSDRATPLRVFGVAAGLLMIVGLALSLSRPSGGELDGSHVLDEFFESADPAAVGLDIASARKLPSGERVLALERASANAGSAEPVEVTFVEVPTSRATKVLRKQFQELSFKSDFGGGHGGGRGRRGGGGGGRHGGGGHRGGGKDKGPQGKLQDAGHIRWHDYEANFARLKYGKGDDAYDVARVNLSVEARCLIAYIRFPKGMDGDRDSVESTLKAFPPPPPEG